MKGKNERSLLSLGKTTLENVEHLVFFCVIVFLPTQLGKHFWPSFASVSGIRIDYLSPTLYLTDLLLIILFFLWAYRNFRFQVIRRCVKRNKKKLLFGASILVFLCVGVLFAQRPLLGWYGLFKLAEFSLLGIYAAHLASSVRQKALLLFALPLVAESVLAIAQFYLQHSVNGIMYFFGERAFTIQTPGIAKAALNGDLVLRPYGTFSHPNVLAGFLLIGMLIFTYGLYTNQIRKKLLFGVLVGGINTIALFLTMSRTVLVLAILMTLCWLFVWLKKRMTAIRVMGVLVGALFIGILAVGTSPFGSRFTSLALTDEAIVHRQSLLLAALGMVRDYPLFGVGLHNFLPMLPSYAMATNVILFLQPVHNIFFLIAAETGLVGFGVVLGFLWKTLQRIWQKKSKHSRVFYLLLIATICILGMVDHYFLTLQQGQLLLAFVLGLCWAKEKK